MQGSIEGTPFLIDLTFNSGTLLINGGFTITNPLENTGLLTIDPDSDGAEPVIIRIPKLSNKAEFRFRENVILESEQVTFEEEASSTLWNCLQLFFPFRFVHTISGRPQCRKAWR